jgi:hypothetical protein
MVVASVPAAPRGNVPTMQKSSTTAPAPNVTPSYTMEVLMMRSQAALFGRNQLNVGVV